MLVSQALTSSKQVNLTVKPIIDEYDCSAYGLFLGESQIHIEYSRSDAVAIASKYNSGTALSEIFAKIEQEKCKREYLPIINDLKRTVGKRDTAISVLESTVDKLKLHMLKNHIFPPFDAETLADKHLLEEDVAEELARLLNHVAEKRFTHTCQLSKYITSSNLGNNYPRISGVLGFSDNTHSWKLEGAIDYGIHRLVKEELGLKDNGTDVRPGLFISYDQLRSRN
ncbi:hypothetical protein ACH42_00765 [Endozoicomonas sp. (ex Bugula neritina AB1)]|nr:hypothetical protein ACH42_00765 [Endozoicomonas sp. (ex Bugula neritina AB1)]